MEAARSDAVRPRPLKRLVTGPLLLFFVLGDVVGGGIYALVGEVAGEVGGAVWASFALALALALFTAGSYAELATRYPFAGGAALYAQRAFGASFVTFMVAFAVMASGLTSAAALSRAVGGDYLSAFVDVPVLPAALALLALLALINRQGIAESLRLNVVLTLVELGGLLLVVVVGMAALSSGEGDLGRAVEVKPGTGVVAAVLAGTGIAFFALVGFDDSANIAEETRDPRRSYPRALFGGLAAAGVLYVVVTVIAVAVVGPVRLAGEGGSLVLVAGTGPLGVGERVFAAIGIVALANGALINLIMASRLAYGMAGEGVMPRVLRRVHPRHRTPEVAIACTAAAAMVLAASGDLGTLAETTVLLLVGVFTVVNGAVLALARVPADRPHFRVPRAVPVLGIGACVLVMTQQSPEVFARAGIVLGLGALLWAAGRLVPRR